MKKTTDGRKDLSELLTDVDDGLLQEALDTDSAEKLRARRSRDRLIQLKKWGAAAACLVLAAVLVLTAPGLISGGNGSPHETPKEGTSGESNSPTAPEVKVEIDSIDKVNFYAGMKIIRSGGGYSASAKPPFVNLDSSTPADSYREPEDEIPGVIGGEDISGETLTITTAVSFELDVTEADEFLYSKVGGGRVTAVMTDLHVGRSPLSMITFKNGESYFSCTSENDVLKEGENHFGTHLYIKGMQFFKDTTNGVSRFTVNYDMTAGRVTAVTWSPYNRIPSQAVKHPIAVDADSTQEAHEHYEFTLIELYEYYNGGSPTVESTPEDETVESTPKRNEDVFIRSGDDVVTAFPCALWTEYYDERSDMMASTESSTDGARGQIASDPSEIPTIAFSDDMVIVFENEGELYYTNVYFVDDSGKVKRKDDFNRLFDSLSTLPPGEWYVVATVVWRDGFVDSEGVYERHCTEYVVRLIKNAE